MRGALSFWILCTAFQWNQGVWDVLLVPFAVTVNSIITFWQDQMGFSFEFYFRSMPYLAKQTNYS